METNTEICDDKSCLFCNAKCPECGSTKITVLYAPVFAFDNETKNELTICMSGVGIELYCYDCEETIGSYSDDEPDPELMPLVKALREVLGLPLNARHESVPLPDGTHEARTEFFERV